MYNILISLILLGMTLLPSSVYAEKKGIAWEGSVTDADVVKVVNFLINNKGKEITLDGKKHIVTGREELDVEIISLPCCAPENVKKEISACGKVKNFQFPSYRASVPAEGIVKLDKNGEIEKIKFEPEKRDLWMKAIQQ